MKPKERTDILSSWILDNTLPVDELLHFAGNQKDTVKATCIEALEFASKKNPHIADEHILSFVVDNLQSKAPRIKWESAKVIGNIAALFPDKLDQAIRALLKNAEHNGTVVRWSAAFALGEILKLKHSYNTTLLPALESICAKEDKNSIRKIYTDATKKAMD